MTAQATKTDLKAALRQAATSTFEELAFLFAAPDEREANETVAAERTSASVNFGGAGTGRLVIVTDTAMLPAIAANMLGEDETSVSESEQHDALGELANVICGNVLPEVGGARAVFNLEAPRIAECSGDAVDAQDSTAPLASVNFAFDEGQAQVMLFLNDAALAS